MGHGSEGGGSRTLIKHYLKSDLVRSKTHALEKWDKCLRDIISGVAEDNIVRFTHG